MTGDWRVPLVVGVTGHRTLAADDPELIALAAGACRTLRAAYPDTPFLVLSSLAEGGDRLLARAAMEHLEARLVVPLPLPPEEYARDFATEASRREFADLLGRAAAWFTVGPAGAAAGAAPGPGRARRYAEAGAWIVTRCHVLLALWDGEPARGPGGTAEVVAWQRQGRVPRDLQPDAGDHETLSGPDPGLLVVIDPHRRTVTTTPVPDARARAILDRLDAFNRDIRAHAERRGPGAFDAARAALLPPPGPEAPEPPGPGVEAVAGPFAAADTLAVHFQRRERRLLRWIYGIFTLALLGYGLIDWQPGLVALHVVSLPLLAALVAWARRQQLPDRVLDSRALAEGLRVLAFWTLAGVPRRVSAAYLARHAGVVAWIRLAVRGVEVASGAAARGSAPPGGAPAVALVRRAWIEAQCAYLAARRERLARWARATGAVTAVAFVLAMAVATLYLVYVLRDGLWPGAVPALLAGDRHGPFQAALGGLGAIGLAAEAYRRRRAFAELARHYAAAEALYRTARARLDDGTWAPEAVLAALGRETLAEHGEWLWLHRSQPLEVPRG